MRVTRTPLRITLGGGGSDLAPDIGLCVTAAIDKHITITLSEPLDDRYLLRYSQIERVNRVADIQHRILRDALTLANVGPGVEITSTSDVPAGTGLGSSGAFTVGVLRALFPDASRPRLARLACELDTGQQDQHAAVYGGVNVFDFRERTIRPIDTTMDRHLSLYYTGVRRDAGQPPAGMPERRDVRFEVAALEQDDPELLGWCLTRQWAEKRDHFPSPFHADCDGHLQAGLDAGAFGGKLIGAGGGGFLLFASTSDLDDVMKRRGLRRLPFRFDHVGTCVQ